MTFSAHHPSNDAGLGPVPARTQMPDWRKWWHDTENPEQDLLHRMLIASPWERYLLDRDTAGPDDDSPRA